MSERTRAAVDVAVIGGGAIGLAIAWRAQTRGLSTIVLERDQAGRGTSRVAAGMLAPISEVSAGEEPLLTLGLRSASLYPELAARLGGAGYRTCGTLLVARDADEAEALERERALRDHYGLEVQRLRPSAARRLEPGLIPGLRLALAVPGDHAIDPRQLTAALSAALREAGGQLHEGVAVSGVETVGGAVSGVRLATGEELRARAVVIAAGAWSGRLDVPAGAERPSLRPVKGQILRLHDPAGPGLLTRVLRMGSSYIVPRGDGRYVIGATSEERGFDTTVTAGAAFELLREAGELVPGVSELVIDEFSAGLRPGTSDNLPVIGPSRVPGLHWATGHGRGGILLAPVTAEIVLASLLGEMSDPAYAAVSPARLSPTAMASPA
ncbi:MAG TPA: glycine oxidase ThiO [Solirubrobacteraceae bacterium]